MAYWRQKKWFDLQLDNCCHLQIRLEYRTWATPVIRLWLANSRMRSRIGYSVRLFSRLDSSFKPIQWSSNVCMASGNSSVARSSAGGKSVIRSIWLTLKLSTFWLSLLLTAWNCWPSHCPIQLSRRLEYMQPQSLAISKANTVSVTSFSSRLPFKHCSMFVKSSKTISRFVQFGFSQSLWLTLSSFSFIVATVDLLCSVSNLGFWEELK